MPKDSQTPDLTLRFGDFLLDSSTRQLSRTGKDVRLSPKAFDLLCALLARRPDVIPKADLLSAVWPDTYVIEANLNVVIAEIRKALGDDRHTPRFIRTVHAVGYAFCGQAVEVDDATVRAGSKFWLSWKDRSFALSAGNNVIGRDPRSAVWLDDDSVSRRHAVITVESDVARVEDLDSTNGTLLNREPVAAAVTLHDNDVIEVGSLRLTFRTLSDASARTKRLRR